MRAKPALETHPKSTQRGSKRQNPMFSKCARRLSGKHILDLSRPEHDLEKHIRTDLGGVRRSPGRLGRMCSHESSGKTPRTPQEPLKNPPPLRPLSARSGPTKQPQSHPTKVETPKRDFPKMCTAPQREAHFDPVWTSGGAPKPTPRRSWGGPGRSWGVRGKL